MRIKTSIEILKLDNVEANCVDERNSQIIDPWLVCGVFHAQSNQLVNNKKKMLYLLVCNPAPLFIHRAPVIGV